jgi:hypothetical protein
MSEAPASRGMSWPIRILIHLYHMRASGYLMVTERDLVRQWENLSTSIRTHLTYLQQRGFLDLKIMNQDTSFVRLTEAGIDFVESGVSEAEGLNR